jgi:hypothetical protein
MFFESAAIILPILVAYVAYNERDKMNVKNKLSETISKKDADHLIDLKNAPVKVNQERTLEELRRFNAKLDQIEKLLRKDI